MPDKDLVVEGYRQEHDPEKTRLKYEAMGMDDMSMAICLAIDEQVFLATDEEIRELIQEDYGE
jgi:hypothetical protein